MSAAGSRRDTVFPTLPERSRRAYRSGLNGSSTRVSVFGAHGFQSVMSVESAGSIPSGYVRDAKRCNVKTLNVMGLRKLGVSRLPTSVHLRADTMKSKRYQIAQTGPDKAHPDPSRTSSLSVFARKGNEDAQEESTTNAKICREMRANASTAASSSPRFSDNSTRTYVGPSGTNTIPES
jgi:hypothetical protein